MHVVWQVTNRVRGLHYLSVQIMSGERFCLAGACVEVTAALVSPGWWHQSRCTMPRVRARNFMVEIDLIMIIDCGQ